MHVIGELAVVISALAGFGIYVNSRWKARQKHNTGFLSREELPIDDVAARFFPGLSLQGEEVNYLWCEFGRILQIAPGLLRPSDRFKVELAPADFSASLDDRVDDLEEFAVAYAKSRGRSIDLARVETLGALLERLASATTD